MEIRLDNFAKLKADVFDFKLGDFISRLSEYCRSGNNGNIGTVANWLILGGNDTHNFNVLVKFLKIKEIERIYLQSLTSNNVDADGNNIKNTQQKERFNEF